MRNLKMIKPILFITTMRIILPSIAFAADDLEQIKKELQQLRQDVAAANEWRDPNTIFHMAGYADVGYIKSDAPGDNGRFNIGTFSPMFHYQYHDMVMLESELELKSLENGETDVTLEYLTIDWFVND